MVADWLEQVGHDLSQVEKSGQGEPVKIAFRICLLCCLVANMMGRFFL